MKEGISRIMTGAIRRYNDDFPTAPGGQFSPCGPKQQVLHNMVSGMGFPARSNAAGSLESCLQGPYHAPVQDSRKQEANIIPI